MPRRAIRLLKDPDTQHLTLSHRRPVDDGERDLAGVLVVARERLRQLTAQLAAIGRPARRVWAEVQTAPGGEGWQLSLSPAGAILRSGIHQGVAVDADLLAPLLAQQAAAARAANAAPAQIQLHLAPATQAPDFALLQAETGLAVATGAPYRWWQGVDRKCANLLHGEFAFREAGAGWLGRLRPALVVGAGALALWLAINVGEALWLRQQVGQAGERIDRIYRSTFPNSPVVAPAAQMRQQLNLERARHGLLRDDDALALDRAGSAAPRHEASPRSCATSATRRAGWSAAR